MAIAEAGEAHRAKLIALLSRARTKLAIFEADLDEDWYDEPDRVKKR